MDAAGKNRYELLFMDDDGEAPIKASNAAPAENINKKKQAAAGGAATNTTTNKKSTNPPGNKKSNAEKENKSQALNKSEGGGNVPNQKKPTKDGASGEGNNNARNRQTGENRNNAGNNFSGSGSGGGGGGNKPRYNNQSTDNNNRSVTFRNQNQNLNQNAENREQRNNRRNFRDNADNMATNNDQRPRQYNNYNRDRENRGPTRKREFDRQSGSDKTGVKAIDKRDGAGAHNWGSVKQEIDDINKSNSNTNSNANADGDATLTDKEESGNDQSNEQVPANDEEEAAAKEMTLDEWKALRQQRSKPQYNLRKAGEGEDTTQWKKMTVLNKKKEGGDSEEELEYDPSLYPQRVGRLQRIVDIQFKFNDDRRSGNSGFGRNRGGPGAGAGGGVGGGGRGPRSGGNYENRSRFDDGNSRANGQRRSYGDRNTRNAASHVPKVDDERQFPTLG